MQTRIGFLIFLASLIWAAHAMAQEAEAPAPTRRDISIQAEHLEFDMALTAFAAAGNVRIVSEDISVKADRAYGWQDRQEVYLEGNVRVRTPAQEYSGDRGFVRWESGEMVFIDFEARSLDRAEEVTWYVKTPLGMRLADGTVTARNARISNCDYAIPHQYLRVRSIEITPGNDIIARGITYYVHGIPLPLYVPVVIVPADFPAINVSFGSSSSFGNYINVGTAFDLPFEFVDASASARVGYFSKRGIGYGVGAAYRHPLVTRGMLDYYVVPNDRGEDFPDVPLGTTYRYRYKAIHSMDVPEQGWELDLEIQRYSDAGFQREWFRREFYYEKRPENRLYLKGFVDNWAAFSEVKIRLNDYLDQTERLPSLGVLGFSEPIIGGLLWSNRTEVGYYRRRLSNIRQLPGETEAQFTARQIRENAFQILPPITPEELQASDRLVARFDTVHEISRPFSAGFLNLEPFVGVRQTLYSKRIQDDRSTARTQSLYGVRLGTLLQRTYDVQSDFFDIDGLRHLFMPRVNYIGVAETWGANREELITLDETELATRFDRIELQFRNKFQTLRRQGVEDFIDIDFLIDYFPDAARDNDARNFSPLRTDARWRPVDYAYVFARVDYDFHDNDVPFVAAGASFDVADRWSVYVSQMYEREFDSFGTYSVGWRITPKWLAVGTYIRNWKTGDSLEEHLELVRDFHCFSLSIGITNDRRVNEQAVTFNVMPKPVGAPPMPRFFVRALPEARDMEE